jgi:hypothetical protein
MSGTAAVLKNNNYVIVIVRVYPTVRHHQRTAVQQYRFTVPAKSQLL